MRPGNRAEHQYQHGQAEDGRSGVFEQLRSPVVRRQLRGGDARPDDDRYQQCGAGELSEKPSRQLLIRRDPANHRRLAA